MITQQKMYCVQRNAFLVITSYLAARLDGSWRELGRYGLREGRDEKIASLDWTRIESPSKIGKDGNTARLVLT
jgi:hypothetical protein